MACPERTLYIRNTNSLSGLENLLDDSLQVIDQNFGISQFRGMQRALPLKRSDGSILLTLPDHIRIWQLESRNWNQIAPPTVRGRYYPVGNKIVLNGEKWCRKTLFHESLHGVSIFSHPSNADFFRDTRLFAEGTTEFMTGLLLWRQYADCHENWRNEVFPQWCNLSYPRETRTLFAFCGCANTQCLIDLYFNTQTNVFSDAWSEFIEAIRRDTGKKFKNVLGAGRRIGLINAFRNECEQQFKRKFRKLKNLLDYSML